MHVLMIGDPSDMCDELAGGGQEIDTDKDTDTETDQKKTQEQRERARESEL